MPSSVSSSATSGWPLNAPPSTPFRRCSRRCRNRLNFASSRRARTDAWMPGQPGTTIVANLRVAVERLKWPIAPVHLRPLKPTFAKTWTNSPTTAKAQTVRTALRQISDSPCRCSREDEQYAHPPQNKKQKTKNALKNTVQRFREPGHCTFDVMQFVQAE